MEEKYRLYKEVPKVVQNGLNARINASVKKYGFNAFKRVVLKYLDEVRKKATLEEEISQREEELKKLKGK